MQIKFFAAAAVVSLLVAGNAGAVVGAAVGAGTDVGDVGNILDFTDSDTFSGRVPTSRQPITGTFAGTGFSITASGRLNFTERAVGDTCPRTILDCDQDGVGVGDDEITGRGVNRQEWIAITFDRPVAIDQIILLDLFIGNRGTERAVINGTSYGAVERLGGGNSGALFIDFDQTVGQLVFAATRFPGDNGNNDYAIGGITAPVPLPASVLMLLGALGGLSYIGRRRGAG
jgi:hypothetical protein